MGIALTVAIARVAWICAIAIYIDARRPQPYELTSLPRAYLVR